MTIDDSDERAPVGVSDRPAPPAVDLPPMRPMAMTEDVDLSALAASAIVIETPDSGTVHDSVAPLSRKLAPPPKPRRESSPTSAPPSGQPLGDTGLDSAIASSALKAPNAPTISYSGLGTTSADESVPPAKSSTPAPAPIPASAVGSAPPLSSPPPIQRRSSQPAALSGEPIPPLELDLEPGLKPASNPPRTVSFPPRPSSPSPSLSPRPPSVPSSLAPSAPGASPNSAPALGAPSVPASAPGSSSHPPSSSAIFAMRIIAVGESQRPVPVQADSSVDPTAYPAALGTRRSSRPAPSFPVVPRDSERAAPLRSSEVRALEVPAAEAPAIEIHAQEAASVDTPRTNEAHRDALGVEPSGTAIAPTEKPALELHSVGASADEIDVVVEVPEAQASPDSLPATSARSSESAAFAARPISVISALAPPSDDVTEELSDEDVSPDSSERKPNAQPDVEELGREDAISVPPEELAAVAEADALAKADVKPPPPPKRSLGAPPSAPLVEPPAAPLAAAATSVAPPTPDLAAAKAAQRAKTRQPWWEDLFNEDFMRASAKVNEEQVRREVTFIEDSLGVAAGGIVLDLGCGAGHHAVEFASRGYGVVGYDLSLYQLALAADVAQERSQKINFLQGDMREMAFEEMFDGVFCWNTTFGYFEEDKNLAVAQRVFKALRPGGMFLIDVLNRDFAAASSPQQVWYEGDACVCMDDMSVDYISSRLRVKRSIILDDGRTRESLFSLRLYSLHELGKLLHEVGFRVTEASGHPSTPGVFFGPNSPRIIILAQRP